MIMFVWTQRTKRRQNVCISSLPTSEFNENGLWWVLFETYVRQGCFSPLATNECLTLLPHAIHIVSLIIGLMNWHMCVRDDQTNVIRCTRTRHNVVVHSFQDTCHRSLIDCAQLFDDDFCLQSHSCPSNSSENEGHKTNERALHTSTTKKQTHRTTHSTMPVQCRGCTSHNLLVVDTTTNDLR
jgi:hypothetical protein